MRCPQFTARLARSAPWLSVVLVALLAAASLWGPGMVNTRGGGDSPFLLQRTHQMAENLRAGVFPVRWMPDAAYGLGYPFFSYYAALPYYLSGLLVVAGLDVLTAIKIVQTLGFVAAGLAMLGWMRRLNAGRWVAWLAAVAYTVAPFHLVNVYVRGDSLSEFYAFVFYPLVLWALDGLRDRVPLRGSQVALPALAYAGLILSHNLSAFIFSPFVLLYLAVLAWRERGRRWRVLGIALLALGLGLVLTAWYAVPALAELDQVQLEASTQGYFHYSNHFRALNLVQRGLLFDYSIASDAAGRSPFAMGLPQALLGALGGLLLLARALRGRVEAVWGFVLVGLLISTLMITPLSRPLWDRLPLLAVVQFPWRFLSVQALFVAAATAGLLPRRQERHPARPRAWDALVALASAGLLIASVLLPLRPERLLIGPADVTVQRLQFYELFTENIGTTIRYEWLPQTAAPRPFTSDALIEPDAPPRAIPLEGASLEATLVEREPARQVWQTRGEGGGVAFPLLHWPGWLAQVDGEAVQVWPVEGSGYLALEVPPGEHTVELRLGRTPVRAAAEVASLAAGIALLGLAVVLGHRAQRRAAPEPGPGSRRRSLSAVVAPLVVLLLLVALVALCRPRNRFGDGDLTADFHRMPYLHHNPDGVDFGVARLVGYALSSDELAPGDALAVTQEWVDVDEGIYTATLRLVSPAVLRHDVEPLAEVAIGLSPGPLTASLPLPEDTPRGLYLLQLRVWGPEGEIFARTPRGGSRGTLTLRPVRVPRGPALPVDAAVLAPFGPAIRLHAATVSQPAPDRLSLQLAWSTRYPLAANYAISLRLMDPDGQPRLALDGQPGYGFLPTSTWRPGELVTDRYLFTLPDDLAPGSGYHLRVVLYQIPSLAALGQVSVGDFALPLETPFEMRRPPRSFSLPALEHGVGAEFGGEVRLAGYELEQGETALGVTLWWQSLQSPQADYTVFVHLFDPAAETIVVQHDAMPQDGTYPTSWWAAGEVVSETATLSLEGVPPGEYQLAVGLFDHTMTRLAAVGPDGARVPDNRLVLPAPVTVRP
jgi:hypothetical protein